MFILRQYYFSELVNAVSLGVLRADALRSCGDAQ